MWELLKRFGIGRNQNNTHVVDEDESPGLGGIGTTGAGFNTAGSGMGEAQLPPGLGEVAGGVVGLGLLGSGFGIGRTELPQPQNDNTTDVVGTLIPTEDLTARQPWQTGTTTRPGAQRPMLGSHRNQPERNPLLGEIETFDPTSLRHVEPDPRPSMYTEVEGQRYLDEGLPSLNWDKRSNWLNGQKLTPSLEGKLAPVMSNDDQAKAYKRTHPEAGVAQCGSNGWTQKVSENGTDMMLKRLYFCDYLNPQQRRQNDSTGFSIGDGDRKLAREAGFLEAFAQMQDQGVDGSDHLVRGFGSGFRNKQLTCGDRDFGGLGNGLFHEPVVGMEFLGGGTLKEKLEKNGPMSVGDTMKDTMGLLGALTALQSVGLSHQDIKSDNVMYDGDGKLKLIDYGELTARHGLGSDFESQPEDIEGVQGLDGLRPRGCENVHRFDHIEDLKSGKSDMWSAGQLVLDMLLGGDISKAQPNVQLSTGGRQPEQRGVSFEYARDQQGTDSRLDKTFETIRALHGESEELGFLEGQVRGMMTFDGEQRIGAKESLKSFRQFQSRQQQNDE